MQCAKHILPAVLLLLAMVTTACREDEPIYLPDAVPVSMPEYTSIKGFYLLNEANMNSNKASIDFYNYETGKYYNYIYRAQNYGVVMQLGDVGNDIGIYGNKLYAVINCSNKVEVMNKNTVKRLGQIDIPNCRYIKFHGGYAYVTSYAGPVVTVFDGSQSQIGYVAKVDTTTLEVVDRCMVGYQPDELEIVDGKIYVANSGGYNPNNYENTISVIDIATFKEVERIPIALNLQYVKADRRGVLWISSRGNYYKQGSNVYAYDTRKHRIVGQLDCPVGNMWLDGDSLYVISSEYSMIEDGYRTATYQIYDTRTMELINEHFITDGTDRAIVQPYGIAVNPITKDILLTDAKNYVVPGRLYCFGQDGKRKWDLLTGDIPAHFVFLGENINEK